MLTVRFPNGQKLTFNRANQLHFGNDAWHLYTNSERTEWVASMQASAGVIVEASAPCRVENEMIRLTEERAFEMVEAVLSEGRHPARCGELAERIKRHLRRFNMQTWQWTS